MDGTVFEAIEDCTNAAAVAISDIVYGLNKGYVTYRPVKDALARGGFTNDPALIKNLGVTFPQNLRDRALLNKALADAQHVKVPSRSSASFVDGSLYSMMFADIGLVDYNKMAFRLFGFRIEALYYLYFTILGAIVAAFILAHRGSVFALSVPVIFLAAGNLIISLNIFDDVNVSTVANSRFLSTLGILPGLHLAILMLDRRRPSLDQVALAMFQVAVFCFALSVRSAIAWMAVFLVAFAVLQGAAGLRRAHVESIRDAYFQAAILLRQGLWPILILVAGVWGYNGLFLSYKIHPTYELDDFLPHHLRYHNAFLGLTFHPHWYSTYAKDYGLADGDSLGFVAGMQYLKLRYDAPESYYISPFTGGYKMRLHDRMILGAYLSFIREHPWVVVEAHVAKLQRTVAMIFQYTKQSIMSHNGVVAALVAGLGVIALFMVGSIGNGAIRVVQVAESSGRLLAVMIAAIPFSWLPSLYAYPAPHVFADQLFVAMSAFLMSCGLILMVLTAAMAARLQLMFQARFRYLQERSNS